MIYLTTAKNAQKSKSYLTTIGACGEDLIHSLIVILIMYMKTAVIYARVSSTTDRQSTTRQVNDLTSYAEFAKIRVLRVYEEKALRTRVAHLICFQAISWFKKMDS